jgi:acyl-CoA synthetase (AMP-forming)/AMP-acid ligase II
MENDFQVAAALTGAWACDAIPVLIDANARQTQLEHAITTVAPSVVAFLGNASAFTDDRSTFLNLERTPDRECPSYRPTTRAIPTDPASIVFTSGSTGKPKGVIQSHGNLYRGCNTVQAYLGLQEQDRILGSVPWSFDYGYGQLLTTIIFGVTQVLPRIQNSVGFCEAIEQQGTTILPGTPSVFTYLTGGMSPISSTDLSTVRMLTNTGGSVHRKLLDSLLDTFAEAELVLNYGLTETYRSTYLPPALVSQYPGTIGKSIPGVDVVVVREDGSLTDPYEEGEIVHRGDYICLGYWGDEASTQQAKRRDPLLPEPLYNIDSLYTGDIGYRDEEDYLYYKGRRDQQLKCMGVRVSPGEVEETLYSSGLLERIAVVGVEHELMGHEICAALMPRSGLEFSQRDLEKFARQNMSQYMLPRRYRVMDELPYTTTGKVDYTKLKKSFEPDSF